MNIFLPYDTIEDSVKALDDKRLVKQILECKQIYDVRFNKTGYANHPVVKFYKYYPFFLIRYGVEACHEYRHRFNKDHKYAPFFTSLFFDNIQNVREADWEVPMYYAEGPINSPTCVRTTTNVAERFQAKLIKKWNNDKHKPKWTNREPPEFFTEKHAYWIPIYSVSQYKQALWCTNCGAWSDAYTSICPKCGYQMRNGKKEYVK